MRESRSSFAAISTLLGFAWATAASFAPAHAADSPPDHRFLFINGGSTTTSSMVNFEEKYLALRDFLKPRAPIFLNGSGKGTPVVRFDSEGGYLRDPSGLIQIGTSDIPESEPATFRNVEKTFHQLGRSSPRSLSVVWSDHGGPNGPTLWADGFRSDKVTADGIQALYRKVPAQTRIKALHLHCFSTAGMVNPASRPPASARELLAFLRDRYPANRCALGVAGANEVGWSLGGGDWAKTKLFPAFGRDPRLSLGSLKRSWIRDRQITTRFALSSDLFLEDIGRFLCEPPPAAAKDGVQSAEGCAESGSADTRLLALLSPVRKQLCDRPDQRQARAARDRVGAAMARSEEFSEIRSAWFQKFMEAKDPVRYRKYMAAKSAFDKLRADAIIQALPGTLTDAQNAELAAYYEAHLRSYNQEVFSRRASPEFDTFMAACDLTWVRESREKFPILWAAYKDQPKRFGSCADAESESDDVEFGRLQIRARDAELKAQVSRARILEEWLRHPAQAAARSIYLELRECEESPFLE